MKTVYLLTEDEMARLRELMTSLSCNAELPRVVREVYGELRKLLMDVRACRQPSEKGMNDLDINPDDLVGMG